jgi:hypothetical protein
MSATLTTDKILSLTLKSFREKVPALKALSTDFGADALRLNETVIAHIPTLPSVSEWDNTEGYGHDSQTARSLMVDVPVTVDSHKFVTLQWKHINNIADQKDSVEQMVANAAYVLGKAMLDSVLAKFVAANVTLAETISNVDVDRETLKSARKKLNIAGAAAEGRVILGNSDFIGALGDDPLIASKDFSGQQTEANAYAHYRNIEGFADIWEYPSFPDNAEDLMGIAFEPRAIALRAGIPDHTFDLAGQLGIPAIGSHTVMSDPETGFTLLAINWQSPATFDLNLTLVSVWGSSVGKQGGSNGTITDNAALRFVDVPESSV